jgi:hypothetical protein
MPERCRRFPEQSTCQGKIPSGRAEPGPSSSWTALHPAMRRFSVQRPAAAYTNSKCKIWRWRRFVFHTFVDPGSKCRRAAARTLIHHMRCPRHRGGRLRSCSLQRTSMHWIVWHGQAGALAALVPGAGNGHTRRVRWEHRPICDPLGTRRCTRFACSQLPLDKPP